MTKNGLKVGDFVEVYPKTDYPKRDHVGVIFDFENRGEDGTSARILWLTRDCHFSIHWNTFALARVPHPEYEDIDWEVILEKIKRWFSESRT